MHYLRNLNTKSEDIIVYGDIWVLMCKFKDAGWALYNRGQIYFETEEEAVEKMKEKLDEFSENEMCIRRIELGKNYKDRYEKEYISQYGR